MVSKCVLELPVEIDREADAYLHTRFPRTIGIGANLDYSALAKERAKICEYAGLSENLDIHWAFLHRKAGRGFELTRLASAIQDRPVRLSHAIEDSRTALANKRVLSLGDDTGSLTELLRSFGCDTIGIEYDPVKVAIANSGYFNEHYATRQDILQGDMWDLLLPNSPLAETIGAQPFDAIISVDLWNGSGAERPLGSTARQIKNQYGLEAEGDVYRRAAPEAFLFLFMKETLRHLKPDGVALYLGTDWSLSKSQEQRLSEMCTLGEFSPKRWSKPDIFVRKPA